MCLSVYLAASQPVPLVPWNEAARACYLEPVDMTYCSLPALTKPYVYFVGSDLGCGCGFSYDGVPADLPEHEAVRSNYQQLAAYLNGQLQVGPIELFVCGSGDESRPPTRRITITPAQLANGTITFEEGQLITVVPEAFAA